LVGFSRIQSDLVGLDSQIVSYHGSRVTQNLARILLRQHIYAITVFDFSRKSFHVSELSLISVHAQVVFQTRRPK
jgi:hypothetical protein